MKKQIHFSPLILTALVFISIGFKIWLKFAHNSLEQPELWEFYNIALHFYQTGVYSFITPGVPSAFQPPAYPCIIFLLYTWFGVSKLAYLILFVLLLCFEISIPFLIAYLGYKIWDSRTALIAFVLSLFWPTVLGLSYRAHSISIYYVLLVSAFCILFSEKLSLLKRAFLCGLLIGIYGYFRHEIAIVILAFSYYLYFLTSAKKRILSIVMLGGISLLITFPWMIRNYKCFGRFTLNTQFGYQLYRGHYEGATGGGREIVWPNMAKNLHPTLPRADHSMYIDDKIHDEISLDQMYRQKAFDFIKNNPEVEVKLFIKKIGFFLIADFTHPEGKIFIYWMPSLIALIVGLFSWRRFGLNNVKEQTLWIFFFLNMAMCSVFLVLPRHRMIVDFVPLLFFSNYLKRGFDSIQQRRSIS